MESVVKAHIHFTSSGESGAMPFIAVVKPDDIGLAAAPATLLAAVRADLLADSRLFSATSRQEPPGLAPTRRRAASPCGFHGPSPNSTPAPPTTAPPSSGCECRDGAPAGEPANRRRADHAVPAARTH